MGAVAFSLCYITIEGYLIKRIVSYEKRKKRGRNKPINGPNDKIIVWALVVSAGAVNGAVVVEGGREGAAAELENSR
jgi:hypothetical protein